MDSNSNSDFGGAADLLGGGGDAGTATAGAADPAANAAAAANAGADPAAGGNAGAAEPDWYGTISADVPEGESASLRDWVKAKGFKTQDDLVKSLRNAERRISEGGGVKPPAENATPEEIAAWRSAIGVPDKPEGYAVPQPKDADGNPIEINTALTERIVANAHKFGVPKAALEGILDAEIQAQIAEYDAAVKELAEKAAAHVKAWGEERDAKLANVNAAAKDAGLTRADMEYLRGMPSGPGKALDLLAKMGSNFSEDSLVRGASRSFGMTAEQAKAEIAAIKADPEVLAKAMVPGSAENARYNRANEAMAAAAERAESVAMRA